MENTISTRIYDFLKEFPPFHLIAKEALLAICGEMEVRYVEEGETVFKQGNNPDKHFFVLREGAIGLYREMQDKSLLIEICDEGDLFGLRPLLHEDAYRMSAIAKEESILYAIPVQQLNKIQQQNEAVASYLTFSFQTTAAEHRSEAESLLQMGKKISVEKDALYFDLQPISFTANPITIAASETIQQAATLMTKHNIGSLLVAKEGLPIGIMTDKDLRSKIATGTIPLQGSVEKIMSAPVITIHSRENVAEAQLQMVRNGITHLCVTEDGSPNSRIVGILSEHDLLTVRGNNPSVLLKRVNRAKSSTDLKEIRTKVNTLLARYIEQGAPIAFITEVVSNINKAMTARAIDICLSEMESEPPVSFAWLALGSQGREEQLLMTDQDNALVFEDVGEETYESVKNYFLTLAKSVTKVLHEIGFEYCPADMMASNPQWCLSKTEWKQQFHSWITNPTQEAVMFCTIFFDFERMYGDAELVQALSDDVYDSIHSYEIFLNHLAKNAIQNPAPIGFFRQFIVESNGTHKNQFDLKARALMPLVDAARVLCLSYNISSKNNTVERYRALSEKEPENEALFDSCIDAFHILLRFRTEQGLQHGDSGRYVSLEQLNKVEKLTLKACFKAIKDVQELLQLRFRLSQML
ncbi:DUF294 nucleotidyltransferase-like domain-containing protein [Luteirhabdus pelagi]|uniref:DUF294 nucleotidyltransferase-like domain-containing protein n=1 Tax=Luteirhabdus pelagi TaxID=2792783 RepID=UPI001939912D|nr:DUF294 nucleotidyltransferase-like domain-containing protein [Luteirhabdus pelagi]